MLLQSTLQVGDKVTSLGIMEGIEVGDEVITLGIIEGLEVGDEVFGATGDGLLPVAIAPARARSPFNVMIPIIAQHLEYNLFLQGEQGSSFFMKN